MKYKLQDMNSKVHRDISSAPAIDRALEETERTPFIACITNVPVRHTGKPKIPTYEGSTDPIQHMVVFSIAMGRSQFSREERDAGHC